MLWLKTTKYSTYLKRKLLIHTMIQTSDNRHSPRIMRIFVFIIFSTENIKCYNFFFFTVPSIKPTVLALYRYNNIIKYKIIIVRTTIGEVFKCKYDVYGRPSRIKWILASIYVFYTRPAGFNCEFLRPGRSI